jgi:predicted nucleotidyltransferase
MQKSTNQIPPAIQETLQHASDALRRMYGPRLKRVILFGSYARGDARPDSDIDVLVVLEGPVDIMTEARRTSGLVMRTAADRDAALSFVHLSDEEFADLRRPLVRSIRDEGIELLSLGESSGLGSEAPIPQEETRR